MDSEIEEIKRRAGLITEDEDYAAEIANTYINGNIKDAFAAIGNNIALFAEVVLAISSYHGSEEAEQFLNMVARRG
jgi:hypothetical protein